MEKKTEQTIQKIDIEALKEEIVSKLRPEIANNENVEISRFINDRGEKFGRYSITFKVKVTVDGTEKNLECAMLIGQSDRHTVVMIVNCYHNDLIFYNASAKGVEKSVAYAASYISKSTARMLGITLPEE